MAYANIRWKESRERTRDGVTIFIRAYDVAKKATLAGLNLEQGDTLLDPDDTNGAYISESRFDPDPDGDGKIARVVALKYQTGA